MSDNNLRRLPSMDGLRACAIAFVLLGHASNSTGWPLRNTWIEPYLKPVLLNGVLGVRIFFVISGFLITSLLLREERSYAAVSLREFYIRRALRILPVLLVYIGVVAIFEQAIGRHEPLPYLHALTFMTGGFFPEVKTRVLAHTWSLSVEEHFYIAWPLIFVAARGRWRAVVAIAIVMVAPLLRGIAYVTDRINLTYQTILGNMDLLMIGCLVALLLDAQRARALKVLETRPGLGRLIAITILFGVQWIRGNNTAWFSVPIQPLCEAVCVGYLIASLTNVRQGALYRTLNYAPIAWIGVLSYSLYIWQQLLVYQGGDGYEAYPFQILPYSVLLLAVIAPLSYYGVERPFLRLKERWTTRSSSRLPSQGETLVDERARSGAST